MKIFVCFIKQASLLTIISKLRGVDSSVLWLSFAQQKSLRPREIMPDLFSNVFKPAKTRAQSMKPQPDQAHKNQARPTSTQRRQCPLSTIKMQSKPVNCGNRRKLSRDKYSSGFSFLSFLQFSSPLARPWLPDFSLYNIPKREKYNK
jgi:hypothetical protein